MNHVYKERFPRAKEQMEERLGAYVHSSTNTTAHSESDTIAHFVHRQLLEIAQDVLNRSEADSLSAAYFYDITENLERIVNEACDKSPASTPLLSRLAHELLMIIARPARLLECLEFDPTEFYHLLEAAEGEAKAQSQQIVDIPQYILGKLCLDRDPIEQLQEELAQCSSPIPENGKVEPFFPLTKAGVEKGEFCCSQGGSHCGYATGCPRRRVGA